MNHANFSHQPVDRTARIEALTLMAATDAFAFDSADRTAPSAAAIVFAVLRAAAFFCA